MAAGKGKCPEYIRVAKRAYRAILEEAHVLETDDGGEAILAPDELAARMLSAKEALAQDFINPPAPHKDGMWLACAP